MTDEGRRRRGPWWWAEAACAVGAVGCFLVLGAIRLQAAYIDLSARASVNALAPHLPGTPEMSVPAVAHVQRGLVGILTLPSVGLSVPVIDGDDTASLMVAAGHLPGTPMPWESGNSAIAGHRDTFFRPLEHVVAGDSITFETPHATVHYRVVRVLRVRPQETWVIGPGAKADLTLVTCYPFAFAGAAPERWIVHAMKEGGS